MTVYDDPHIYQTIGGVDYVTSLGGGRCGRAIGGVAAQLVVNDDVLGWWFLRRIELHIQSDITVPDISGWSRPRMPQIPWVDWFEVAPDWVCEVLTPETETLIRTHKLAAYAAYGVEYAWLVDPNEETIEVHRLVDGRWSLLTVHTGDSPVRIEPFTELELRRDMLWVPSA